MGDKDVISQKLRDEVSNLRATVESQRVTLSEHGLEGDSSIEMKEDNIVSFRQKHQRPNSEMDTLNAKQDTHYCTTCN